MHPLVQVYTIPRTTHSAYVKHVVNLRQNVTRFLSTLPTLPANMPFVKVRPRNFGGMPSRKAPFSVNVEKLRCAFIWLRANNLWYRDVEWREDWAKEWAVEDVDVGTTRDEDVQNGAILS